MRAVAVNSMHPAPPAEISARPGVLATVRVRRAPGKREERCMAPFQVPLAGSQPESNLTLPWIHPGQQQQRMMHKAHYWEYAYTHGTTAGARTHQGMAKRRRDATDPAERSRSCTAWTRLWAVRKNNSSLGNISLDLQC